MKRSFGLATALVLIGLTTGLTIPASAQHFQQVKGTLVRVAAGRNEVFGIDPSEGVWRYHAGTQSFSKIGKTQLNQIAVGGGTLSQLDEVWGVDDSSRIWHFNYGTKAFDQVEPALPLTQITVGLGNFDSCHPYEVWGLDGGGDVYRYDYCSGQFNQSPGSSLAQIVSNAGAVWGTNDSVIYHYNFYAEAFQEVPGFLFTLAAGVDDLWGISVTTDDVYRYDLITDEMYTLAGGVNEVAAGGDGVWIIASGENIYRFDSSLQSFVQVPGSLVYIASGSGAGVWGINESNQVFTFVRP